MIATTYTQRLAFPSPLISRSRTFRHRHSSHYHPHHFAKTDKIQKSHGTHLPLLHNRNNNLTLRRPITRNMSRKTFHIRHQLRPRLLRRGAANSPAKRNDLACYLALERAEKELRRVGRVGEIEACPIDVGGGRGQGVVGVPEEGGGVGEVAGEGGGAC